MKTMYTQITCSGKPTQSMVFHGLIDYYTNADDWLVSITWLSGPIRAERTVTFIICTQKRLSGWIWCFEDCMSSVILQVQQLYGAEHIVTSHETPSPPQTETQSTQDGEGETPVPPWLSVLKFCLFKCVLISRSLSLDLSSPHRSAA